MMGTLTSLGRLSVRELWISYQLLIIVALLGLLGLLAPLAAVWIPRLLRPTAPVAATTQALTWYGLSLGVASVVIAAIAARSIAADRVRGTAAWVLAAPVTRATFFVGWMLGVASATAGGMVLSAVTAWFAIASLGAVPDAGRFSAAALSATVSIVASATIGLLYGAAFERGRATAGAAAVVAGLALVAWLIPLTPWLPSTSTVRFQDLVVLPSGIGMSLQVLGSAIAVIGVVGYGGTMAMDRAEL